METLQSFSQKLAIKLNSLRPRTCGLEWRFHGELGDLIEYDNSMIGVIQFATSTEEIYGNRTQRLEGTLTGQVICEQADNHDIQRALDQLQAIVYDYIGGLRYTDVGDAVVLQGTCDSILTNTDGQKWTFVLPLNLVVQF